MKVADRTDKLPSVDDYGIDFNLCELDFKFVTISCATNKDYPGELVPCPRFGLGPLSVGCGEGGYDGWLE